VWVDVGQPGFYRAFFNFKHPYFYNTLRLKLFSKAYSMRAIWSGEPTKRFNTIYVLTIKNKLQNYFSKLQKKGNTQSRLMWGSQISSVFPMDNARQT